MINPLMPGGKPVDAGALARELDSRDTASIRPVGRHGARYLRRATAPGW
jgi:hypothetical protein